MVKSRVDNDLINVPLKLKVRFDYRGVTKPKGIFFSSKNIESAAEEAREHKAALLRNVPFQGIQIEDIETSTHPYTVVEGNNTTPVAYAPVIVTITAEAIEDVVRFIMRDEFRKVEVVEPDTMELSKQDIERFLFRANEELRGIRSQMERRGD
ncbi:MAG: hypothetical protein HPY50_06155 [Firmicutes bacterium]|nr:hypothetical protein [Bacillota bacterium]